MVPHVDATLDEIKDIISHIKGQWSEDGSGKHTFRSTDGGILNFWPSKGTINFQGKQNARQILESLLMENSTHSTPVKNISNESQSSMQKSDRKIFIVHGHDTAARDQLELALHRLGIQPFVLMNNASQGKTLIEALEGHIGKDYSSAYGIVLMTPDDIGYSKKDGETKAEPRARQNVILETGMLLSSLTRNRMSLIVKGHIELPSDLEGIIRLGYNDNINEIVAKLCQNLKSAGFHVTSEAITRAASS